MTTTSPFITYIAHEKRYSAHTVVAYKKDLSQFQNFLQSQFELINLLEVTREHIRSWVIALNQDGVSATSINRKISTLKSFYKYLLRDNKITALPTEGVNTPKQKKELPQYIPLHEMNRLLNDFDFPETFEGYRDELMIELLYTTGIRSVEIMGLTLNNVKFNECAIKVLGKRNKERIIPLTLEVIKRMEEFIRLRNSIEGAESHSFVFITKSGKKIYHGLLYKIVNNYLSLVCKQSKTSPHVLRHTFATHMLNNGADLNGIKSLLGHASLASTQIYTHNSIEKLKTIHNQAHPRGGRKK